MMRGDRPFSEFTYAFAATHELTRLTRWWSKNVPIIPSLSAEGRLGYDVRFDLPGSFLFIQFKLGVERERLRLVGDELQPSLAATQLRNLAHSGIWQFWTTSHQHRLLTKLASNFETAYYFAPKFNTQAELNYHFAQRSIARSSFIVRADSFPGPRSDQGHRHRVIGPKAAPSRTFIFSEPTVTENIDWSAELVRISREWPNKPPIALQLSQLWKELPGKIRSREKRLSDLRRAISARAPNVIVDSIDSPLTRVAGGRGALRQGSVRRVRVPPWQNAIPSIPIEEELGGGVELTAKLMIVADELARFGISVSVAQPTNASL